MTRLDHVHVVRPDLAMDQVIIGSITTLHLPSELHDLPVRVRVFRRYKRRASSGSVLRH
ncbi:hypothetical protein Hanom_Chr01g00056451 [Helianthus anomalus]